MNEKLRVGILGATGMIGQHFITLLQNHPWFEITALCASERSKGVTYEYAVRNRWKMKEDIPENIKHMVVQDVKDIESLVDCVDFVFSALSMSKEEIYLLEESYAKAEIPVISNNSAHRNTVDVPMIIPEINDKHLNLIPIQMKRLGTRKGFIITKPNCSIQSYVPPITAWMKYEPTNIVVSTYQAVSGAGKRLLEWQQIQNNMIPYIADEEEKSENEPLRIWGEVRNERMESAIRPRISAQCIRVPVEVGHLTSVFVDFAKRPTKEQLVQCILEFYGEPQRLELPSAPKQFIQYVEWNDRPQNQLDAYYENGMGITVGRLRRDKVFDYKFVSLSHNTIRGAAGGAILCAELLKAKGYIEKG